MRWSIFSLGLLVGAGSAVVACSSTGDDSMAATGGTGGTGGTSSSGGGTSTAGGGAARGRGAGGGGGVAARGRGRVPAAGPRSSAAVLVGEKGRIVTDQLSTVARPCQAPASCAEAAAGAGGAG